jgi:hypothetical protein
MNHHSRQRDSGITGPKNTSREINAAGKYRVIIRHSNNTLSTVIGCQTLKEACAALIDTRRKMYATTFTRQDTRWEYKSYDITDAWICSTSHCPHTIMFDGMTCLEQLGQTGQIAMGKCLREKCGKKFEITRYRKAYCDAACRKGRNNDVSNRARDNGVKTKPMTKNCLFCQGSFTTSRFDVVYCSLAHNRADYYQKRLAKSAKIEDAVMDVMHSMFEANGNQPVMSSAILNVVSVSHGVSAIKSYLAQGNKKGRCKMLKMGLYIPVIGYQQGAVNA